MNYSREVSYWIFILALGLIAYYSDSEADRKVRVLEAKIAFLRDNCPMPQAAREKLTVTQTGDHLECALMSDQGHGRTTLKSRSSM